MQKSARADSRRKDAEETTLARRRTPTSTLQMQIQKPSFFKILLGDFATVLRLPLLFVEVYGERLSPTVSLATGASPEKSWAVKVEKSGDHWVLGDGWSAFVKGNRLEAGDFAIFWLMDNWSTFKVRLYDCTCCDKQLSSRFFSPGGFPGLEETECIQTEMMCED
ncbi:unnamed protein product [Cuscuta campestris]|uniref:TF-B3 domain-containing protein n=1 Tax=Cuscuta campestris TaxID=132261 RepID=A0A484MWU8_9ASTE|nr:unnamed protein product [Cuscuta campestris]